jgi:hypothetical protein
MKVPTRFGILKKKNPHYYDLKQWAKILMYVFSFPQDTGFIIRYVMNSYTFSKEKMLKGS